MSPTTSHPARARRQKTSVRPSFRDAFRTVSESVPPAVQDDFVRTVAEDDSLDAALWGPAPSRRARHSAAVETLRREFEVRRDVLRQSLRVADAAELLDVSEQAILDRIEAGDLVGLRQGRPWWLPAWQFDPDTVRGFLPGLARLQDAYPGGALSLTQWVTTPNVELDGAAPIGELKAGNVDRVVAVAAIGTAAAW